MVRDTYLYPLPKNRLLTRYRPAFDAIGKGNSATIWGFTQSCDWVFLKFIFSRPELLNQLLPKSIQRKQLFLFFDIDSLPNRDPIFFQRHLLTQIYNTLSGIRNALPQDFQRTLDTVSSILDTRDPYTYLQTASRLLSSLFAQTSYRLTMVIHDYFLDTWEESWGRNLYKLWHTHRRHPDARVTMLFVTRPYVTPDLLPPFLKPLRWAYYESVSIFPLFTKEETYFTLDRHEKIYGIPASNHYKDLLWKTLGGFYDFYLPSLRIMERHQNAPDSDLVKAWLSDETNRYHIKFLFDMLPPSNQQKLERYVFKHEHIVQDNLIHKLGLLPVPTIWHYYLTTMRPIETISRSVHVSTIPNTSIKTVQPLTASEHTLLDLFLSHPNSLVTKDEIAENLDSAESLSDWAIDKLVSRLRAKISTPTLLNPILTVRGKGYKLII